MTPDQLITFATVAELRNISRAAELLHLSQPAVSGQLRQLQDEFGEPLYLRDGRGVRLTPVGEALAPLAATLVALAASLRERGVKISFDPNYRNLMTAAYRPTLEKMV
ncbi:LysR family transcriptional regulator, partial [Burkholderia sp. Ap-962]|uniref:helix-turn-helix domain-containing protein n=1 Tax=Burkholderia sp. Ap-962 TaxID=2608333 RepID=UPI001F04D7DA